MHLILLSGGSGKRLWPLSNDIRSKQFLQVLPAPDGSLESMVQRVYRQMQEVGGWSSITVAASATQRDQLENQLGKNVNIVIEPERRDTFPAIALACSYLYSECGVKPDESIAVLPVDPFVDLEYFKNIARFSQILNTEPDSLVLMGATPTKPSDKYGYVVPTDGANDISDVKYFKEKPDLDSAKNLISEGALWNCGVFGLKLSYITDILKDKYTVSDLSFGAMKERFLTLNKTSFDYEVVEHVKKIKVLKYNGSWTDLGTWETLSEEMTASVTGNAKVDELCENTHVINEQDIPVITMGIKNAVVVASRDGILVAEKGQTYRLKDFIGEIKTRPMYEEKRWGTYQVLNHSFHADGTESLTKKLSLLEDKQISYQKHANRKEVWTIVSGEGWLCIDEKRSQVGPGDTITIQENQAHALYASTDLELIEVQLGKPLIEEDIVRITDEFDWSLDFLQK